MSSTIIGVGFLCRDCAERVAIQIRHGHLTQIGFGFAITPTSSSNLVGYRWDECAALALELMQVTVMDAVDSSATEGAKQTSFARPKYNGGFVGPFWVSLFCRPVIVKAPIVLLCLLTAIARDKHLEVFGSAINNV